MSVSSDLTSQIRFGLGLKKKATLGVAFKESAILLTILGSKQNASDLLWFYVGNFFVIG